jgi:hypothetical protein
VRGDGTEPGLRQALAAGRRELAAYIGAGVAYVAIGVAYPEFLFTWVAATGYLLLCLVVLPTLLRRR